MDADSKRRIVRAARALVRADAESFAKGLGVSLSTVRRIEGGAAVADATLNEAVANLSRLGVEVIDGASVDGVRLSLGLGLTDEARVGPEPALSRHAKPTGRHRRTRREPPSP